MAKIPNAVALGRQSARWCNKLAGMAGAEREASAVAERPSAMGLAALRANEGMVPLLPCLEVDGTLLFWRALGFVTTWEQRKPYVYLALRWRGVELHYGPAPKGLDPALEHSGGCLVMVDEVAPYHAEFTAALRRALGKVPASGRPRITRFRPGASRFTIVDGSGNSVVFIQRGEKQPEYGGRKGAGGLGKALDDARVFREFKLDDEAAVRALLSALRRHEASAPAVQRAQTYATLVELGMALGDSERTAAWRAALSAIELTDEERASIAEELGRAARFEEWLKG